MLKCSCIKRLKGVVRKWGLPFFLGLVFSVVSYLIIDVSVEHTSTPQYCVSCHEMDTAYKSWELSIHGSSPSGVQVSCVDCHLPRREDFFRHLSAKMAAGAKDVYMHNFGGTYDLEENRQFILKDLPQQRCLNCHNNLMGRPESSAARSAHQEVMTNPDSPDNRCIKCHENAGHLRNSSLFPVTH